MQDNLEHGDDEFMDSGDDPRIAQPDDASDDIEIEEIDDTPEDDRARTPLPYDPTDPEHARDDVYLTKQAQKRTAELTKAKHDERRAREAAERERDAAVEYARRVASSLKSARTNAVSGEKAFVGQVQANTDHQFEKAQEAVARAYEEGDPRQVAAAQAQLALVAVRKAAVDNYVPPLEAEDDPDAVDDYERQAPRAGEAAQARAQPTNATAQWVARNPWFQKDQNMTDAAMRIHAEAVQDGYLPDSPAYFRTIDSQMRQQFRHYGWDKAQSRTQSPPVAGGRSSTAATTTNVVRLTASEVEMCKRMGIDKKDYAREKQRLEKKR